MIQGLLNSSPILLQAVGETLLLSLSSMFGAFAIGLVLAEISLHGGKVGALAVRVLTQVVRGTPVLVFVFLVYYTLPVVGIRIDKTSTAVISLAIFFSVFFSEIVRSAVSSIPMGQRQSGQALGMSRWEIEKIVIFPQALRVALPPTLNLSAIIVKSTSIVSIIGAWELTYATNEFVMRTMQPFLYFLVAMAIYFCICFSLVQFGRHLERRLDVSYRKI